MLLRSLAFSILVALSGGVVAELSSDDTSNLAKVLAAQPDERKARYAARHPQQTLEFFGIEPGMTVVEMLPGRGWYSPILVAYLGSDGRLIGADYPRSMWGNFPFSNDEFLASRDEWLKTFPQSREQWGGSAAAPIDAVRMGEFASELNGTVDAVLFIRALHNLSRFEDKGGYRTAAIADSFRLLKPGGVVGVVQHKAPPGATDSWADGSRGYLNQGTLIAQFEAEGFELAAISDVNRNPRDNPGEQDIVWRLPPSLSGAADDPELKARMEAIGESNRMTLLFRKPRT